MLRPQHTWFHKRVLPPSSEGCPVVVKEFRRTVGFRQVARDGEVGGMSRMEATDTRAGLTKKLVLSLLNACLKHKKFPARVAMPFLFVGAIFFS